MKKLILLILLPILFSSCFTTKVYPLKGNYPTPPLTFHSDKPIESVWDNLIDLFAQKGLSIKILDKSSGLIVSEKNSISFTLENKRGKPIDPYAYVVIPTMMAVGSQRPVMPNEVMCEWNVRIKPKDGGTDINVNLVNFSSYYMDSGHRYPAHGISTGQFEKWIFDSIR